jgi:hypothetical protein
MESTLARWIVVLIAMAIGSGGILAAESQPASASAQTPTAQAPAVPEASQKPAAEAPGRLRFRPGSKASRSQETSGIAMG